MVAYLHEEVKHSQRNNHDGEEGCSHADDNYGADHTQETQDPRAQGHWNGFIHSENVL